MNNLDESPLVDILTNRERELEKQIAIASIYRPVEILNMMGDFKLELDQSVFMYWKKLKSKEKELIMAGIDACCIANSLIDPKTSYEWGRFDKPNMDGADNAEIAIKKLKAYRHNRICLVDIQDDLSETMRALCAI